MGYARAMTTAISIKGVLIEDGQVALLENERGEWELPGGRVEPGEDPAACLVREFAEELGAAIVVGPLLDCWNYEVLPGRHVAIVTYTVMRPAREALQHSAEHRRFGWFGLDELDALPLPEGYRRSIRAATAEPPGSALRANCRRSPRPGCTTRRTSTTPSATSACAS